MLFQQVFVKTLLFLPASNKTLVVFVCVKLVCILQNKFEEYNLLNSSSLESIHIHVISNDKT